MEILRTNLVINEGTCQGHATLGGHYGGNAAGADSKETPDHMCNAVEMHNRLRLLLHFENVIEQSCRKHAHQTNQIICGQAAKWMEVGIKMDVGLVRRCEWVHKLT